MDEIRELTEQTSIQQPRIDRENGIIHRVHLIGLKSANGYEYSKESIQDATRCYEQMPVGIDHDYSSSPLTVGKVWGTLYNPSSDSDGAWADLHYIKSHPLTEQILEDAERGTKLYGLSSVNGGVIQEGKIVKKFTPRRIDIVVKPATTISLLEQTMEVENKVEEVVVVDTKYEQMENELKTLREQYDELKSRMDKFNEYITPQATLAEQIAETTKGIDLKQFWNEEK